MYSQKTEQSEKHLDKSTASRIWSVEEISQTHAPLLYFSAWWFTTSALMANYAKLLLHGWAAYQGSKSQRAIVSRKTCMTNMSSRLQALMLPLPRPLGQRWSGSFHSHRRGGVAFEWLARRQEVKTLLPPLSCDVADPRWSRFINSSAQSSTRTSKRNDFPSIY